MKYQPPYINVSNVVSVHDGDTITVTTDLGRRLSITETIRLYGVNSPELSTGEPGQVATKFVKDWFFSYGNDVVLCTRKDKKDKYGRLLATVFVMAGDLFKCLNTDLVGSGNAVPYLVKSEADLAAVCQADLHRIIEGSLR